MKLVGLIQKETKTTIVAALVKIWRFLHSLKESQAKKIKSSSYSRYYAEACNESEKPDYV